MGTDSSSLGGSSVWNSGSSDGNRSDRKAIPMKTDTHMTMNIHEETEYPYTCFGVSNKKSLISEDISPEQLRWIYMYKGPKNFKEILQKREEKFALKKQWYREYEKLQQRKRSQQTSQSSQVSAAITGALNTKISDAKTNAGQTSANPSQKPTPTSDQKKKKHSSYDLLRFKARNFEFGKIPSLAPPKEECW